MSDDDNIVRRDDDDNNAGIFLRWSRITKAVSTKAENSGLVRGSIVESREDFKTTIRRMSIERKNDRQQRKQVKTILDEVSGYAAPGEILAMMG